MKETKHKKLLLVANTTWNIYNFRLNVIQKLLDEGHTVTVLAPVDEYIEYKEKFPQVRHIGLRTLDRDSVNPLKDILLTFELVKKYKALKPDFIIHYTHKPNIYGTLAAKICGIKSIPIITGLGYSFINKGYINFITKQLYKFSTRFNNKVIFENQDDRILFENEGIIKPNQGVSIKGCGVDTEHFKPRAVQKNGRITFSFIGRLLYDKGFIEYAEAAKRIKKKYPHALFQVIGEFDESNPSSIQKDDLVNYINNDVFDYIGFAKDVRPYIAKSDCIILPSYREAIARSITEAMSMSVPVIATDVPGCREAVTHGETGFLVKPKDIDSLVSTIEFFLTLSVDRRLEMGQAARKKAQKEFEGKIIANEIYEVIEPMLA